MTTRYVVVGKCFGTAMDEPRLGIGFKLLLSSKPSRPETDQRITTYGFLESSYEMRGHMGEDGSKRKIPLSEDHQSHG